MGMSASQARLLSITARMNDVEFKSQQISNAKMRLTDESQKLADDYTKALNKSKLVYTDYSSGQAQNVSLNPSNIGKYGFQLMSRTEGKAVSDMAGVSSSDMYEMIQSGEYYLVQGTSMGVDDSGKMNYEFTGASEISIAGNNQFSVMSDDTELAKAEAEYDAATTKLNQKEKQLDNDLKSLDTEHSALKTEFDSVKSLIGNNIEKSFNLFS